MVLMKKTLALFIFLVLLFGSVISAGLSKNINKPHKISVNESEDYYFIQITDTHIIHEKFQENKTSINRLKLALREINSIKEKPKFVVMTGDLVEWGGKKDAGELNYQAFKDCFYENNNQLYVDSECKIPLYSIPGNHDYLWETSLENYHKYISNQDRYVLKYYDTTFIFMDSGSNAIKHPKDWLRTKGTGLSDEDIEWLTTELEKCTTKNKIILMHHPAVNNRDSLGEMGAVISKNRGNFVSLCEEYNVELVLCGHTHSSRVFDADENRIKDYPMNCSNYPTLFVQSEDCTEDAYYRNISFVDGHIFLEENVKIEFNEKKARNCKIPNFLKSKQSQITLFSIIRHLLMNV